MHKKAIFPLLCCLLSLTLLSGCGSGQQAGEAYPGEDPIQTEGPELGPADDNKSETESIPTVPQSPSISAGQAESTIQQESETTTPDAESAPPVSETPSGALELPEPPPGNTAVDNTGNEEESSEMKMNVQVGASTFTATLEDNAAVDALVEMMENGPVTIQMSDYAGFEKVGALGTSLPTSNRQTTTQAGDIVLYQGSQIVLFYGSNSWSYTRLGKIDDLTGWAEALGSGDVSVTFSLGG